jgi:hypothetical protein
VTVANDAYLGAGGGVRFYVGKNWGFKPEVRYQRYQGSILAANSVSIHSGCSGGLAKSYAAIFGPLRRRKAGFLASTESGQSTKSRPRMMHKRLARPGNLDLPTRVRSDSVDEILAGGSLGRGPHDIWQ